MATKVLSISLGSEIVKVCEVMLAGKRKVQVFNAIDLIVPEGLCEDGVILDAASLAEAIKQGLKGEGFSAKKIVFTINSKRIANKEAIIPFCKENRIKDIVQINASEYFPISNLDNYTFNHSIIEVVQNESVKNYRLSVTATPNELIEQYYELAREMGMSVEAIDYSGNSILQLLKLQTAGEGVDAVLQVGAENTVVNIMNGSTMVMQRSVPYGRLSLVDAVKSSANVSDEEADGMLMQDDIGDLASKYGDVADAVRTMLSSIGRILEFYRARNAENPVERVFVIGDVSSIAGLPDLINNEMDYEVQVVERLRGVEIKNHKVLSDEIVANYLANIGAVIAPLRISIDETRQRGEKAKSDILVFENADQTQRIEFVLGPLGDCQTLDDVITLLGQSYPGITVTPVRINEYDTLVFGSEEADSMTVLISAGESGFLRIIFHPISDPTLNKLFTYVMASVQQMK